MPTPITRLSSLLLTAILFTLSIPSASATVGGPTYFERLSYSASENALYYLINDQGGRGCLPEIAKLDLKSGVQTLVLSCDEIESTYFTEQGIDTASYEQAVQDTFKSLSSLPSISLPNNDISIAVEYIGEHQYENNVDNISADFQATIRQGDQEKGKFDFVGCYKDQPNVFRGYAIPESDKIVVMLSRVGDCFEGGYTEDDIYLVDGIQLTDTTDVSHSNDYSSPSINRGNLVVTAVETSPAAVIPVTEEIEKSDTLPLWGMPALLVVFLLGYILGNKFRTR